MADADNKQLLLRVDASVELARRNLATLERQVASDAAKMDASLARIDGASGRAGAAFGALKTSAAGFLAGLGISTVLATGKAILDFADDIGTAADQAGISVERYQTLREGLRSLEVGTEQTDKILKTLTDTLGKVQSGVEDGATKALDRLGITTKITSGEITTADQLLDALAAASKGAGSAAQFTSDIVDVLGKKLGVDLAAAIRDGGTALHQAEADLRATGGVITSEMVDKLADANEAIDKFAARAKTGFAIFAANAIDGLDLVEEKLARLGRALASISPIGKPGAFDPVIRDFERRGATAETLAAQRAKVQGLIAKRDGIAAGNGVFQNTELPQARNQVNAEAAILRRMTADFNAKRATSAQQEPAGQADIVVNGKRLAKASRSTGGGGGRSATSKEIDYGPDLKNLDPTAGFDFDKLDPLGDPAIDSYLKAVQEGIDRRRDAEADLFRQGEDRVHSLANLFEDALTGRAGSFWEQFKRTGLSAVAEIAARLLTNNGGQGGGLGAILSSVGTSIFSGLGFADGGIPPVGKASLVGERGPELFVPKVPGTIIPNHALGGGRSLNLSVSVNGVSDKAEMQRIAYQAAAEGAQHAIATSRDDLRLMMRPGL